MVILMGVSGSGKTVVGRALAKRLGGQFVEGDDFHPASNVRRMRAGIALTDADRWPWLERLSEAVMRARTQGPPLVVSCAALKKSPRRYLRDRIDGEVMFVHLSGSFDLISRRLEARDGHFMPADLLHSQFADLEAPESAVVVDVGEPVARLVDRIVDSLERPQSNAR
ncbi:MAG TPA: gluconokinase [Gammaproteobacteria bacterium]|nr:gluconokinase [Gammaproteobacteria bacterium]